MKTEQKDYEDARHGDLPNYMYSLMLFVLSSGIVQSHCLKKEPQ